MYIVGVSLGDAFPWKVGRSSNPIARLSEIQTGCPYPLVVLHEATGRGGEEADWHRHLAPWRLSGEWFDPPLDVRTEFLRLLESGSPPPALPPSAPTDVRQSKRRRDPERYRTYMREYMREYRRRQRSDPEADEQRVKRHWLDEEFS